LTYPYPFSILIQDLPSLFASKCHALLCRKYEKGRDWFDFLWYLSKKSTINLSLLKSALYQAGPYQERDISLNETWLQEELKKKIIDLDWKKVQRDVESFLHLEERKFIDSWGQDFFLAQIPKVTLSRKP